MCKHGKKRIEKKSSNGLIYNVDSLPSGIEYRWLPANSTILWIFSFKSISRLLQTHSHFTPILLSKIFLKNIWKLIQTHFYNGLTVKSVGIRNWTIYFHKANCQRSGNISISALSKCLFCINSVSYGQEWSASHKF